jgi:hypothetical protein
MAYPYDMNDFYGAQDPYAAQPFNAGMFGNRGGDMLSPTMGSALLGGGFGIAQAGVGLVGQLLAAQQQAKTARQQMENQLAIQRMQGETQRDVAGINTAPALQNVALLQAKYGRGNDLLNALLAGGSTSGSMRHGPTNPLQGQLAGLFQEDQGPSAVQLAQQSMAGQPNLLSSLQQGGGQFFQGMPQGLFQQQLNQILGNASSSLGGQLRGANAGMAGAGMAPGSGAGMGLQRQFGNQAAAGAQNAMTGAFLNKYGQDFQRQQAQAGYNTQLANLGLGQQQQNQAFGLNMGQLGLGQQQQRMAQRGQKLGLLSQLLA